MRPVKSFGIGFIIGNLLFRQSGCAGCLGVIFITVILPAVIFFVLSMFFYNETREFIRTVADTIKTFLG